MDFGCVPRLVSLSLVLIFSASAEGQIITATLGQDVTLPCQARNYRPFEVVEWSRSGKHSEYVLVFDQKASDLEIPEQNYKGRVSLPDMEKGDASLKLENVTAEDEGTYECYVVREANRKKRDIHPISIVNLVVASPGNQDGNRGEGGNQDGGNTDELGVGRSHAALFVAVSAFAAVSVVSMVMIAVIRRKRIKTPSPPDDAEEPQLI